MAFNPFPFIWKKLIKPFGPLIGLAIGRAISHGLSDDLLKLALAYVKEAAKTEIDKAERREWVVGLLVAKGVPESIARFAVETAYQVYKRELEKDGQAADNTIVWGG